MDSKIIDGKKISLDIKNEVKEEIEKINKAGGHVRLAVILVGNDSASHVYVRNKKKACEYTGIISDSYELPEETTEDGLLSLVDRLNNDESVNGILVQLPLPSHINEDHILMAIDPKKDVDGFHPVNVGSLSIGRDSNGKLCGDVDFSDVYDHVEKITPVPGGVGPMTIAMLMRNCLQAYKDKG